jgi:hypothetical protein
MPVTLEEEPTIPRSRFGRRSTAQKIAGLAFRVGILLFLCGFGFGSWYLARRGFGRQWRYKIVEELHKRGVEASIQRLTLDPFRGLVARNVRIFDYKHHENTIAVISEIALDINYAALLHRQPFLNALDVRNAQLIFPIENSDPKSPKPELTHFRAHIYFPPEQIYLSQAEGIFCGVRLSATGQLIKRENYKPTPETSAAEWRQRLNLLQRIASELGKFTFGGVAPRLQINFTGDLSQLENAHADATLTGYQIRRGHYQMDNFVANAEWTAQRFILRQCEWRDDAGTLAARAEWSRQTGATTFQARSTLNLKSFLGAFGFEQTFEGISFTTPPLLDISGVLPFGETAVTKSVIGQVSLNDFTYKDAAFTKLRADFSWDGNRTMVRDIRLQQANGALSADLYSAPNDFRLNVDSTINPDALRTLVSTDLQQFLSEWEWPRPPTVHLIIRGMSQDPATWKGDGTVAMDRTRFRGVWMNSARANLRFADGAMTFDPLRVTREEGVGTGSFTYDWAKHEVRLTNVQTSLRPSEAIYWVDPKLAKPVAPYKFRQPPKLTVNGVVQFHGGKNTHLEIAVDAPKGMDYVFIGKTLSFEHIKAQLLFTDDRLQVSNVQGPLLSGTLRGTADISLARDDPHYKANLVVDGINFPRLTDLYFNYHTAQGQMSGEYDFTGVGDRARLMRGTGKIYVNNGDIFAIPIFGPLSRLIGAIIPGTGYSVAHNATSTFNVKDGVVHTDDFHVDGKLFGMIGHGDVHFLDDKLDFDVRINANIPGGVVLAPVYKLFEYKGEGSLSKPNWHPKRF